MKILRRRKIRRPQFDLGRGDLLDPLTAKADDAIGLAFVDHKMKVLDRPGPVGAAFQHIVDPSLDDPSPPRLIRAFQTIDQFEEIVTGTVCGLVPLHLRLQRLLD